MTVAIACRSEILQGLHEMDFPVRCECGRVITVSAGSAGARFPCVCGQTVEVPSLGALRQSIGLPAVDVPLVTGFVSGGWSFCWNISVHVTVAHGWRRSCGALPYLLAVEFPRASYLREVVQSQPQPTFDEASPCSFH